MVNRRQVCRPAVCSAVGADRNWYGMQEVDRVVSRVRARENEQHDALGPVCLLLQLCLGAAYCVEVV